jgi:TIR domain
MTDVFVSYKREDEARVARLVAALERSDLQVWWDRSLPGGESWRAQIITRWTKRAA